MKKLSVCLSLLFIFFSIFFVGCGANSQLNKVSRNLTSYDMDIKFDEENMQIVCSQNVKVKNNYDVPLKEVCFNLYPTAFSDDAEILPYTTANSGKVFPNGINYGDIVFEKVKVDDKESVFSVCGEDNNVLKIPFEKPLEMGEVVEVFLNYAVNLAECTHRLGYFCGSVNLGNFFPILAIYENGEYKTTPYYSTGDPFYSDIANFLVKISYPEDYNLACTGYQLENLKEGNTKIDMYNALAVRDFKYLMWDMKKMMIYMIA